MKRHLAIYVENEEFAQLKQEATQRKMSLSRHVKERLLRSYAGGADPGAENTEFLLQTVEQRVVKAVAVAVENGGKGLAENLRTGFVWETFMKTAEARRGMERAGFHKYQP